MNVPVLPICRPATRAAVFPHWATVFNKSCTLSYRESPGLPCGLHLHVGDAHGPPPPIRGNLQEDRGKAAPRKAPGRGPRGGKGPRCSGVCVSGRHRLPRQSAPEKHLRASRASRRPSTATAAVTARAALLPFPLPEEGPSGAPMRRPPGKGDLIDHGLGGCTWRCSPRTPPRCFGLSPVDGRDPSPGSSDRPDPFTSSPGPSRARPRTSKLHARFPTDPVGKALHSSLMGFNPVSILQEAWAAPNIPPQGAAHAITHWGLMKNRTLGRAAPVRDYSISKKETGNARG